jgi:hypothetical protein
LYFKVIDLFGIRLANNRNRTKTRFIIFEQKPETRTEQLPNIELNVS